MLIFSFMVFLSFAFYQMLKPAPNHLLPYEVKRKEKLLNGVKSNA